MSLRKLPEIKNFKFSTNIQWDAPSDALAQWAQNPVVSDNSTSDTISIFDPIGETFWDDGVTAKRIAGALRAIGNKPVTVQINSPGGSFFEGISIYNLLRQHSARVTVEIFGIAASIASIIAMAGDEIRMGTGSFLMVHNAWGVVIGNARDMRESADVFDQFDNALVDIYEARTGLKRKDIEDLLEKESFLNPENAIKFGFADSYFEIALTSNNPENSSNRSLLARRRIEASLAQSGMTRQQRSQIIADLDVSSALRDASGQPQRDAGFDFSLAQKLLATITH